MRLQYPYTKPQAFSLRAANILKEITILSYNH